MFSYSKRDMYQVRKPVSDVTPLYEDAALFKTALCDLMLELIPQMRRNERHDLIVRGFVDRKTEVDIFFAGRRATEVGPMEKQLKALMSRARKRAEETGGPAPDVLKIRLPVRAQGAWRRTLHRDESGWETGTYHFVVARWSLLDRDGKTVSFGESPVVYTPK